MIVLFPTIKKGSGDISFIVKIANYLSTSYDFPSVVIVSEHAKRIQDNFSLGHQVKLFDIENFTTQVAKGEIIPTLIIEGPTFVSTRGTRGHPSIPKLFITEYSSFEERHLCDSVNLLNRARHLKIYAESLESGLREGQHLPFNLRHQRKITKEFGILLESDLLDVFPKTNDKNYRKKLWNELTIRQDILEETEINEYDTTTHFYFHYGHQVNSSETFLQAVIQLQKNNAKTHCEIITVGENSRQEILNIYKDELTKIGYDSIQYISDKNEKFILKEVSSPKRLFKLRHIEKLKQEDFRQLFQLSEIIVGTTGDQSFSEAVALGKIPVYEVALHKQGFFNGVIRQAKKLELPELVSFLSTFSYRLEEINEEKKRELNNFDRDSVYQQFLKLREHIIKEFDLFKYIKTTTRNLLLKTNSLSLARAELINWLQKEVEEVSSTPQFNNKNYLDFILDLKDALNRGLSLREAITIHEKISPNIKNDLKRGLSLKEVIALQRGMVSFPKREENNLDRLANFFSSTKKSLLDILDSSLIKEKKEISSMTISDTNTETIDTLSCRIVLANKNKSDSPAP